jgi:hypothetical protein
MNSLKALRPIIAIFVVLSLSGCRPSDFDRVLGRYQGVLTEKDSTQNTQFNVTGEITSAGYWLLGLKINASGKQSRSWDLFLNATRFSNVWVQDRMTRFAVGIREEDDNCYINDQAPSPEAATTRICYRDQGNQIRIDLAAGPRSKALSVTLYRQDSGNMPVLEVPADYTLSQLIHRGITRSFTSQIEFQSVVQASLSARSAHLNLIPHFTLGDALGIGLITNGWVGLVRMVGNLAPFLIPSNWFKARAARFESAAEQWGYQLMQANAGNISAGLVYTIERDRLSLEHIREERALIARVREEVYDRERLGFVPEGSTDAVDTVINACDKMILGLGGAIGDERRALALAAGFFNPEAIVNITIDHTLSVDRPETYDPKSVAQIALNRAAELKQMDFLIASAATQRKSRYFDWLDPSGGGTAIGFGMGAYIAIGASQVQQAMLKRQQVQAQILQSVAAASDDIEEAVAGYQIARKNVRIHDSLVQSLLNQMRLGYVVTTTELITGFGGQLAAKLDVLNTRFQYLAAHENMQRLLYAGAYAKLGAGN